MGQPTPPPPVVVETPPPVVYEVPADWNEFYQSQSNDSKSESDSESTSVNSASQSNVQINNNSNRIEYGSFKIPETTLSLNGYVTENGDFGGVITLNIPLGGKSRSSINKALDTQVAADQLKYETNYASACANIHDGGFVVTKNPEVLEQLSKCDTEIVKRNTPPVVVEQPSSDIDELKLIVMQQQQLILQLQAELQNRPVQGGY